MTNTDTKRDQLIKEFLFKKGTSSSSAIHEYFASNGEDVSLVTVKRALSDLRERGSIVEEGAGPSTVYRLTISGKINASVDAHAYSMIEPDRRYGNAGYDFGLFKDMPFSLFDAEEISRLEMYTAAYRERKSSISEILHKKELERFIIELSWKSSRIEGNTYTLLDTERLIEKGIAAPGKTKEETLMILGHKRAFSYIYEHQLEFEGLTKAGLESVHRLLTLGLNVAFNIRSKPVGVTGSKYRPLDNQFQMTEAVEELGNAVLRMKTDYDKAILAILGVSYIQPFEDGNKRASRLMGNAILLSHDLSPLSYRSTDEDAYREAIMAFYELNSVEPFRKIFIEQYRFAAENYAI